MGHGGQPTPGARARQRRQRLYEGKIYLVGGNSQGHNGGAQAWFDCYDPGTNTWTVLPDAPRARDHFLASVVGNRLVLAGGRTTDLPDPFDKTVPEVDVYDFTAGTWKTIAEDLPTERGGTMAVSVGRHVIVAGGETSAMLQAHDDVEALDVLAERWVTLPTLVSGRHSGGIGVLDGRIFIASGAGNQGGFPELATSELLAASDVLAQDPMNLLDNGGFSEGLRSWSLTGSGELAPEAGVEAPGLRLSNGTLEQVVPGQVGVSYTCTALYRRPAGGAASGATIRLEALDGGGGVVSMTQAFLPPSADLRSVELTLVPPAGATSLAVGVFTASGVSATVDDLTLAQR